MSYLKMTFFVAELSKSVQNRFFLRSHHGTSDSVCDAVAKQLSRQPDVMQSVYDDVDICEIACVSRGRLKGAVKARVLVGGCTTEWA